MNELIASVDMNGENRAIIYFDLHVWYILRQEANHRLDGRT